ncbi:MAG: hypothetical protein H8E44_13370 [Planctomycetes bacterium]|nr:hypothetical protein [Planctomycetota bacterium]MBL7037505.1 hypothetical protein [Pirellulaceae bacterium]
MTRVSNSYFRRHIEDHFDDLDLDVVCRKRGRAYAIYWADDEEPLARLRPTGQDDEVEVHWWDGERWNQVGEFGRVLPLDEALEYITDDPDDLFFELDSSDDGASAIKTRSRTDPRSDPATGLVGRQILTCSLLAGAAGGAVVGPIAGLAWDLAAGLTLFIALSVMGGGVRFILVPGGRWVGRVGLVLGCGLILGTIAAFYAAPGAVVGSAVTEAMAGGFWAHAAGLLVGAFGALLALSARLPAWLVGFSAGLLLAAPLMDVFDSDYRLVGLALVSLTAAITGRLYSAMAGHYRSFFLPAVFKTSGAPEKPTPGESSNQAKQPVE